MTMADPACARPVSKERECHDLPAAAVREQI